MPKRAFKKSPWIKLRTVKQLQAAADQKPAIAERFSKLSGGIAEHVQRMLATLTPREQKILEMRFGVGGNSDATDILLPSSEEALARIRQIEVRALAKLRRRKV